MVFHFLIGVFPEKTQLNGDEILFIISMVTWHAGEDAVVGLPPRTTDDVVNYLLLK